MAGSGDGLGCWGVVGSGGSVGVMWCWLVGVLGRVLGCVGECCVGWSEWVLGGCVGWFGGCLFVVFCFFLLS